MCPNFPQQVAEASDSELFVNAIIHYTSMGSWLPEYEKAPRLPLPDVNKITVLFALPILPIQQIKAKKYFLDRSFFRANLLDKK